MGISTAELDRVQSSMPMTSWSGGPLTIAQPDHQGFSVQSIEELALDGMLAARHVRQTHPGWFQAIAAKDLVGDARDVFSLPDLVDVELEEFPE